MRNEAERAGPAYGVPDASPLRGRWVAGPATLYPSSRGPRMGECQVMAGSSGSADLRLASGRRHHRRARGRSAERRPEMGTYLLRGGRDNA
jgi:hypothetical protein